MTNNEPTPDPPPAVIPDLIVGHRPPQDGRQYDCQCARCGSSVDYEHCWNCEDGYSDHDCGEDCCCCLDPEQNVPCDICDGLGGFRRCLSSPEWCNHNPLPGRETVQRGTIEWFLDDEEND